MSERVEETLEELKADRDAYRRALVLHLPVESFAEVDEAFGASGLSIGVDRAAESAATRPLAQPTP